jgi:hypothetical protein
VVAGGHLRSGLHEDPVTAHSTARFKIGDRLKDRKIIHIVNYTCYGRDGQRQDWGPCYVLEDQPGFYPAVIWDQYGPDGTPSFH